MALKLQDIRSLDELDALESSWRRLEATGSAPTTFQSWDWCRTWCEHALEDESDIQLRVRTVEDGAGRIIAILPLVQQTLAGRFATALRFTGGSSSYNNDVLLAEPTDVELIDHVISLVRANLGHRSVLHLKHLVAGSPFTKRLVAKGIAAPMCTRLSIRKDPNVTGKMGYISRSTRKRLRYKANKLHREHVSEFKVRRQDELPQALETLVALHRLRFDAKGKKNGIGDGYIKFLRSILRVFKDRFEIAELHAAGRPVASRLMLLDGDHCFGIQTGFDPAFAGYSPMRILLNETIRHSFDDLGCEVYDMGPGYERYKLEWRPSACWNYCCCIGGRGPYARVVGTVFRTMWFRSLPNSFGEIAGADCAAAIEGPRRGPEGRGGR